MRQRLLAWLLTCGTLASADVFLRQPANIPASWARAYHTPLRLQNGKGELEVFRSYDALDLIGTSLENRHGDQLVWVAGEITAWAIAIQDGWITRYLVQPLPDGGFWILSFRQSLREAGKPGEAPSKHQLKDLPALPQSTPGHYSLNEDNQMAVEISETFLSPETALQTMAQLIEADGWSPSPINTGGFQVFIRGEKVAFIGAERGKDGITRILRLHKPLGVK
ncbi:hypothetical protein P0Y35_10930 [Kiritimatiellaeota bacterium B1221]|nr:hypothetical protein [Kiritimatiellaeota bacterium B1221]